MKRRFLYLVVGILIYGALSVPAYADDSFIGIGVGCFYDEFRDLRGATTEIQYWSIDLEDTNAGLLIQFEYLPKTKETIGSSQLVTGFGTGGKSLGFYLGIGCARKQPEKGPVNVVLSLGNLNDNFCIYCNIYTKYFLQDECLGVFGMSYVFPL